MTTKGKKEQNIVPHTALQMSFLRQEQQPYNLQDIDNQQSTKIKSSLTALRGIPWAVLSVYIFESGAEKRDF